MLEGFVPWPAEFAERYRAEGYWRGRTLYDLLRSAAHEHRERTAVVAGGLRLTFGRLLARVDETAAGLYGLGIRPGDRVIVHLPNQAPFVMLSFALFRLGAVPVMALPGHRRNEIVHLCRHTDAVAYVVPDRFQGFDHRVLAREVLTAAPSLRHVLVAGDAAEFTPLDEVRAEARDLPPADASQVALLLLSGGTTGLPKLIPRTHDDYAYNALACAEALGMDRDGAYLAATPVAHNAALGCPGVLGTLFTGGKAVLAPNPSPEEALPLLLREGVTLTTLVPPLVMMWLADPEVAKADLSGLLLQVGSSKFQPEVARRVTAVLGCRLTQWYGIGEGLLTHTRLDDPEDVVLTTEGRPLSPADEIRVVDGAGREVAPGEVGELLARGPYTIRGYYRAPEHNARAFTPDGFFRTGDLVRLTEEGNVVVSGRVKDIIHRGGDKVSAEEVESHLLTHPAVRDVAVVGLPDERLGERVCAFVVPSSPDGEQPRLARLKAYLTERGLAAFKLPDRLELVDAFPKTPVGKVDKKALRARDGH
ncbi:2,3-dihydroxybenzoate-AMP ligase [Streptomyces capoamus]|uniref:2,3-dihydroxybenzoate-AMP ligase n=1 Tax=Streptomyces capoamus TaxID=68183 RepID=A0A919KAS9_9ACTN|nr:AMP-binding protein [Streptomyces capoamus]GGW20677.1 2,3-dihydroxybenzoate-AMP ligase [Streptomyces libani subsp. rufus]GHG57633.1 2,3-dihydroxybenzoate-AMP ligase [Streptomyces capoamus]